jgi:hypothetical protein
VTAPLALPGGSTGLVVCDLLAAAAEPAGGGPTLLARSDGRFLLYTSAVSTLSGPPGSGKSFLALAAIRGVVRLGQLAILIDFESKPHDVAHRLFDLGVTAEQLASVVYLHASGPITDTDLDVLRDYVTDAPVALVVLDTCAEAHAADGVEENSAREVTAWNARVLRRLARAGPSVLVVDHVGKYPGEAVRSARGSSAKLAAVDGVAYSVNVGESFSRHRSGSADLVVAKDRAGHIGAAGEIAARISFEVGDGTLRDVRLDPPSASSNPSQTAWPEDETLSRVRGSLTGVACSRGQIAKRCKTPPSRLQAALETLEAAGAAERVVGPRGGERWRAPLTEGEISDIEHWRSEP